MASNRTGDIRNIVDPGKNSIQKLPTEHRSVTRRVTPDQVSSYKLTVHTRGEMDRLQSGAEDTSSKNNRELDPGEFELGLLTTKGYRMLQKLVQNQHGLAAIFDPSFRQKAGTILGDKIRSAAVGVLVKNGKWDELNSAFSLFNETANLSQVSSATWRNLIKYAPLELVDSVMSKRGAPSNLIGEVAVLSNTLLRKGVNSLAYLLPYASRELAPVRYVDLPNQQLFNLGHPTLPTGTDLSQLHRSNSGVAHAADTHWIWSPPRVSNWTRNFLEVFKGSSIRVSLHGFPQKRDLRSNTLNVTDQGLSNQYMTIRPEDILKVLGGFHVRAVGSDGTTPVHESWPWANTIVPVIGTTLEPSISSIRGKLANFSSYLDLRPKIQINDQLGQSELDVHTDSTYMWRGSTDTHRPYVNVSDDELFGIIGTPFPHPLVKKMISSYLPRWDEHSDLLSSLAVSLLPFKTL